MRDEDKTKEQLVNELLEMRMRIADLEGLQPGKPPMVDEAGSHIGALHILSDITKRKPGENALGESEIKFRMLAESIPDAVTYIHALNENKTLLQVSPQVEKILGYTAWECVQDPGIWNHCIHPEDYERVVSEIKHCEVTGQPFVSEYRVIRKDGGVAWLHHVGDVMRDENGRPASILGVTFDISRYKWIEETLRESEARYRNIFENAMEGIYQTTPEGRYLSVNPAFVRMFGYASQEEMLEGVTDIGRQIYVHPEDRERLKNLLAQRGRVEAFETQVYRGDGRIIWISINARVVRNAMGAILYYEGTNADITERKQAEEELQKLASVVRYSSELINLATVDGKMIFLNEAGAMALGVDPDEVEKTNILQVFPDHLQEKAQTEILPTLMKQGHWEGELQCRNLKTGKLTDLHTLAFTIKDPDTGVPMFLANVSRDITERKRAEELLRQSEEKFSRAFQANPAPMSISALRDGRIIDVNESFLKATGCERAQVIGRTGTEVGFWDQQVRDDLIEILKSGGKLRDREIQIRVKSGDLRTARFSAEMIKINGEPCVLAVADDITEQKRAERALQESQRQLSDIIDFLPDPTLVIDLQGRVIAWNLAMEEMTRISKEDILGRGKDALAISIYGRPRQMLVDLVLGNELSSEKLYDHLEQRGKTFYAEAYVPGNLNRRSGQLWATSSPLCDRDGKVIGAIESIRDITERKEMERTLREREKELEAKSVDLQETNTALRVLLKHREADQKEFGINVVSNLKELVFPYLEKLKSSGLNEMQRTYTSILESHLEEIAVPFLRRLASEFTNLSPMERQIASLIKDGKRNKEISTILGVSLNTISTHRYHLRTKLGLKNKNINLVSYLKSLSTL